MPIYDFKCQQCGAITEQMHRYPRRKGKCLTCGGPALRIYSVRPRRTVDAPFWSRSMGVHPDQIVEEKR
ncbi:MAG: zinc ribbon domain-containing protein, partial [Sedimentisphaerales bacterium]|nr:zinc ribbon domain-containing protein [Sedimentisphaerales bacterium]